MEAEESGHTLVPLHPHPSSFRCMPDSSTPPRIQDRVRGIRIRRCPGLLALRRENESVISVHVF